MKYDRLCLEDLQQHQRWLKKLATDLTRNAEAAEDLVQDAFLAVLRRPPPAVSPPLDMRAYLAGVVRNLYRMAVRTDVRRERRESLVSPPAAEPAPDLLADRASAAAALLQEVDRLSEPYRSTLLLRYYEGLEPQEIAGRLGLPPATVRKRNQLALDRLRQQLARRGQSDTTAWLRTVFRALVPTTLWPRRARTATAAGTASSQGSWLPLFGTVAALLALVHLLPARFPGGAEASAPEAPARRGALLPSFLDPLPSDEALAEASAERPASSSPLDDPARAPDERCAPLQARIDAAPAGATLKLQAGCLYREKLIVTKPLDLLGAEGAEIRGSDIWTRFTPREGRFVSAATVPPFPDEDRACVVTHRTGVCVGPEQVFRDGQALERVGSDSPPGPGQFALDDERRVILGADPQGHRIEVTTRLGWLSVAAHDVLIDGLRMRHAASPLYALAVINPSKRVTIRNSQLSDAAGACVSLAGEHHRFEHNQVFSCGREALRLEPGFGAYVLGNELHHARLARKPRGWTSGGIALVLHPDARLENNHIHHNGGMGIFSVKGHRLLGLGNRLHDNTGAAFTFLKTNGGLLRANQAWSNGAVALPPEPAVFITSSRNIEIVDNVFAHHAAGVLVGPLRSEVVPASFDTCQDTANNHVHDNVIVAATEEATHIEMSGDPRVANEISPCPTNRIERNRLWPLAAAGTGLPLSRDERDTALRTARIPAL
ncbi:MAG: sigma-70 family RNA polymerase sigma factor [Myxococcales bacterium]|nr:sigma-70 family RNA polymerase sigma factor [Myxococcales bacterium]